MTDTVTVERAMAAKAEDVAALISDVTRMGEWSPETTGCSWIKGATGPAVGAKFRGNNAHAEKTWSTTCTITEWEPGKAFTFRVTVGPVKVADWSYALRPTDDGCVVTETWTDLRNGLVKKLSKGTSGVEERPDHNRSTMEITLQRLQAAAEA